MGFVVVEENEIKKAYSELEYEGKVYRLDYIITSSIGGVPSKIDCYISQLQDDGKVLQFGYCSYSKDLSTYVRIDMSVLNINISIQAKLSARFFEDIEAVI
jgi:hypothetical protein